MLLDRQLYIYSYHNLSEPLGIIIIFCLSDCKYNHYDHSPLWVCNPTTVHLALSENMG